MEQDISKNSLDEVIDWLGSQNFKVTRPFEPREFYNDKPAPARLLKAAILDTETTGTNQLIDRIIELGIVVVEYCPETGQVYRVLQTYNELEDPEIPISPESTNIHGITDAMVHGKRIVDTDVENLMSDVSLVIAHNATFDRGFVETRLPFFQKKAWACSFAQIPWKAEGIGSASLEFLAYKCGFHFSGHRASVDCHALLEVLQSDLPQSGIKAFKMLLDKARSPDIKVWAINAPFDNKDKFKDRAYRWDGDRKTWHRTLASEEIAQEIDWLRTEVYANRPFKLEHEKMDAYNRFTMRRGSIEVVNY
jgi:DNA polymerase III subunit epsilon